MVLNNGWCSLEAEQVFEQISTNDKKVKTIECLEKGLYPVIDQGQGKIAGYINDIAKTISVDKPLVIFGDHTRAIKWVDYRFVPGADGTKILKAKAFVDPRFLYYQLSSIELPDKGYARHFKELKEANFLVPSFAEQQEIATRLDDLLAQVDAIKVRLDAIPAILKRFRQAVLAAAVSGKMVNSAIWKNVKLSSICTSISDGDHQAPPKAETGIPFLVISNLSTGKLDFLSIDRFVPESYYKSLKDIRIPKKFDLLYTVTGSFGISVIVDSDQPFCFQRHIAILKPNSYLVNFRFLNIYLSSSFAKDQAEAVATGTAQKTVPLNGLRNFNIKLPPLKEQTEIVNRVEQLFAFADQIEQQVQAAQTRVNQLTQAILAKAFKGELTAAWRAAHPELISGENSAEALLEKIKVSQIPAKPKSGKTTNNTLSLLPD